MRSSSCAARGPVVSQPERSVSATASISSSPIEGGWKPGAASPSRRYRRTKRISSAAVRARASASSRPRRPRSRLRRGPRPAAAARSGSPASGRSARRDTPSTACAASRPSTAVQHPFGRDEEQDAGAPDRRLCVSETRSVSEREVEREVVQLRPRCGLAELRVVAAAEPRSQLNRPVRPPRPDLGVRRPVPTPSASAAAAPPRLARLCASRNTRPGVRQRDTERRWVGGEAIGDQ